MNFLERHRTEKHAHIHSWVRIIKIDLFSCVKTFRHAQTAAGKYFYKCKKHMMQHMEHGPKSSGKTIGWLSRELSVLDTCTAWKRKSQVCFEGIEGKGNRRANQERRKINKQTQRHQWKFYKDKCAAKTTKHLLIKALQSFTGSGSFFSFERTGLNFETRVRTSFKLDVLTKTTWDPGVMWPAYVRLVVWFEECFYQFVVSRQGHRSYKMCCCLSTF